MRPGERGLQQLHPPAVERSDAPKSDNGTIYIATSPDRATDGSFLSENVETLDLLTDGELQSGTWVHEDQLDPGRYWLMPRASLDFDLCYRDEFGDYDPSCADGYSSPVPLTVPRPMARYSASVNVYRYLKQASLRLAVRPLGDSLRYRVCYRLKTKQRRCLSGSVDGYDWSSGTSDTLTVSTRRLAPLTTFTWLVGGRMVATKRVRVR